ncbi:hypothetical protein FB45DRAFT_291247 [Roridomyces roridus]|uniref:Zinc-finger domain-containing protein n=1 Tax=Roridomyces roridus TaxID=1738132 RepID=A0AAD7CB54_9AGAR|nr:hypothetical protein FB45DRAFT_291247 [Roridomyces roridus]
MSVPPRREENLQEGSQYKHYVPYNSPFDSYPLMRMRSQRMLSSQSTSTDQKIPYESCLSPTITTCSSHPSLSSFSSSSSSSSLSSFTSLPSSLSSVLPLPDLTPLKLTALDPAKRICQYEVPGGGICRDAGCNDLHLSRLEGAQEPNGMSCWFWPNSLTFYIRFQITTLQNTFAAYYPRPGNPSTV